MSNIVTPKGLVPPDDFDLIGIDGNAGAIMGAVSRALRKAGNPPDVIDAFRAEAMSDDYTHLLQTAMAYTS